MVVMVIMVLVMVTMTRRTWMWMRIGMIVTVAVAGRSRCNSHCFLSKVFVTMFGMVQVHSTSAIAIIKLVEDQATQLELE